MLVSCGPGPLRPFLSPAALAMRGYSIIPGILGNAKRGLRLLDVVCKVEMMPTSQAVVRHTDDMCRVPGRNPGT